MCIKKLMESIFGKTDPDEPTVPDIPVPPPVPSEGGTKKAFLWGVDNYPGDSMDLDGCLTDVNNMYNLLVDVYKFSPDNIRVLTDDRATKQAILERLEWLLGGSQAGDELVYAFSSHGSQVRDRNDDELTDDLDEICIPYDHDWDYPLLDDTIGEYFKMLHPQANLTMIADCCHSGTMDRSVGKIEKKVRFITPPLDISMRSRNRDLKFRQIGRDPKGSQRHTLISGCKSTQYSVSAYISGQWQGALTWSLITALRTNPNQTYDQAYTTLCNTLRDYEFEQEPQLTCNNTNRPVFGGI